MKLDVAAHEIWRRAAHWLHTPPASCCTTLVRATEALKRQHAQSDRTDSCLHQPKQLLNGPAERRQALPKVRRANENGATRTRTWGGVPELRTRAARNARPLKAQAFQGGRKHPGLGAVAMHQQKPTTSPEQVQQAIERRNQLASTGGGTTGGFGARRSELGLRWA